MDNTKRVAQEAGANGIFNPGTSTKDPKPTAKGKERIQKGDAFMPDWKLPEMEAYWKSLPTSKEKNMVLVYIKRKQSKTFAKIAEEMHMPLGTVRGWLVRGRARGRHDLADHKAPGKVPVLNHTMVETIRGWLSKSPTEFEYTRSRWQTKMMQEMIRKHLGVECSEAIVRRTMHRLRHSYRKSRPAPRKSASKEEQENFKKETAERLMEPANRDHAVLAQDEATCKVGGWNGYGWQPIGGRETIPMSWSKKSVHLIGVLGNGWFFIAMVDSANSETLKKFLDRVRNKVGDIVIIMDNVSYHKSATMNDYVNDSNGGVVRILLPKYTPQLNPIEMLWRDLKHALAGSYFDSVDELKAAITKIVQNSELRPTKLMDYMLPDGAEEPGRIQCQIWDMTTKPSSAKTSKAKTAAA